MYTYEHICNSLCVVKTQAPLCLCSKCLLVFVCVYIYTKYVLYTCNVTKYHKNTPQWTLWCTTQIPPLGLKDSFPQLQRSCLALTQLKGVTWHKVMSASQSSPYPKTVWCKCLKAHLLHPAWGNSEWPWQPPSFLWGWLRSWSRLHCSLILLLSFPFHGQQAERELPIALLANLHLIPCFSDLWHTPSVRSVQVRE